MSWKQKLVRRVLPLWAAAALSLVPLACLGRLLEGRISVPTVLYLLALLPLVAALYSFTIKRRWWWVLAGAGVFGLIGTGSHLNTALYTRIDEEAAVLPLIIGFTYLAVAVHALRDRTWELRAAIRSAAPGLPTVDFVLWAGGVALCGYWWQVFIDEGPMPAAGNVAWVGFHGLVLGAVFQFAMRSPVAFSFRAALSYMAIFCFFGVAAHHLQFVVLDLDAWPTRLMMDVTAMALFVLLAQDELKRRLPGLTWRERQKAFVGRVTVAASAASAVFLFAVGIWITTFGRPSLMSLVLVVPLAGAVITFLHFAVICRLRTLLVVKLSLSAITILAVVDAILGVAFRVGDAHAVGLDHLIIATAAERLLVGIASFGVVAWSIMCTVTHFEDRDEPINEDEQPAA